MGKHIFKMKDGFVKNSDTLADLKLGNSALINGIKPECDSDVRQRLLDLGFVKGAEVNVKNISPLGDPVAYYIHETLIALRKEDALMVCIDKLNK